MVLFVSLLSYTINTCCKMEDMMPTLDQTRLHLKEFTPLEEPPPS